MAILNEVGSMWIEKDNATGVHLTCCLDSVDKLTQVGREWAIKWNFCVRVCRLCGGRIAQSVEHSANNAAVQGSSPCMTILPLFLLPLYSCYAAFARFDASDL